METQDKNKIIRSTRGMENRGGEVRRIHVVYFLCRMGKAEQPHLVRVHHLNRSGVRLRDVKRWLGELRGKDMPDSFAWSYKRKYKTEYVWQDLLDDDLITPISDNEYYLKGSEISSLCPDTSSPSEISLPSSENSFNSSENSIHLDLPEKLCEMPPKSNAVNPVVKLVSFKLEDERSTETDSTVLTKSSKYSSGKTTDSSRSWSPSSVNSQEEPKEKEDEHPKSQPGSTFSRSKSKSSTRIRNLLTCRRADTNESAIMQRAQYQKNESNKKNAARPIECKGEICKIESLGGQTGNIHRTWSRKQGHAHGRKSFGDTKSFKKADDSLYKLVAEPNCSQCGKGFKPEKLHAHMKSCRGMKNRAKRSGSGGLISTTRKPSEAKREEPPTCLSHTKTEEQTTRAD